MLHYLMSVTSLSDNCWIHFRPKIVSISQSGKGSKTHSQWNRARIRIGPKYDRLFLSHLVPKTSPPSKRVWIWTCRRRALSYHENSFWHRSESQLGNGLPQTDWITIYALLALAINLSPARERSARIMNLGNICGELTALDSYCQVPRPILCH